jgi:hypothetical protein
MGRGQPKMTLGLPVLITSANPKKSFCGILGMSERLTSSIFQNHCNQVPNDKFELMGLSNVQ